MEQGCAFELVPLLYRQREFSLTTYGPGLRTGGIVKHIHTKADEVLDAPLDLVRLVDIAQLAFDAAMRAGFTPEEITAAYEAKQAINRRRQWPDWRTRSQDNVIEHIRTVG